MQDDSAICDSVFQSSHERGVALSDGCWGLRCFVLKLSKRVLEARELPDASATRLTFIKSE
jgi:hypothetical protein